LGFILLVAGVAFVAGLAVKNAKQGDAAAPAIPAAAPLAEAKPVEPLPQPVAQVETPAPPAPPTEQPSETPAVASPPPALAAPENEPRRSPTPTVHAAKVSSAEQAPRPSTQREAPPSTVLPVRSANVAAEAPPVEAAFDSEATTTALNAAAQRASSCRKQSDPSGVAVVTITFAPSGRVTSANISGPPFAGTETGSCIASVLRGVKVPAYSGDFMTVRKTIQVE
ncbi:MAG TPA: hypothetical protein VFQ35_25875, partial [Polyangiaceae bacterium]|nr:hypothetical protein [Polyangiaceae bacterium]